MARIEYEISRRSPIEFFEVVTNQYVNGEYVSQEYTYEAVCDRVVIDECDSLSTLIKSLMTDEWSDDND